MDGLRVVHVCGGGERRGVKGGFGEGGVSLECVATPEKTQLGN